MPAFIAGVPGNVSSAADDLETKNNTYLAAKAAYLPVDAQNVALYNAYRTAFTAEMSAKMAYDSATMQKNVKQGQYNMQLTMQPQNPQMIAAALAELNTANALLTTASTNYMNAQTATFNASAAQVAYIPTYSAAWNAWSVSKSNQASAYWALQSAIAIAY